MDRGCCICVDPETSIPIAAPASLHEEPATLHKEPTTLHDDTSSWAPRTNIDCFRLDWLARALAESEMQPDQLVQVLSSDSGLASLEAAEFLLKGHPNPEPAEVGLILHLYDRAFEAEQEMNDQAMLQQLDELGCCYIASLVCCPLTLGSSLVCYCHRKAAVYRELECAKEELTAQMPINAARMVLAQLPTAKVILANEWLEINTYLKVLSSQRSQRETQGGDRS